MTPYNERLAKGLDWSGYLALDNAHAVADRIKSMIGSGQRYTWVAVNEYFGHKPEVRTSQVATKVDFENDLQHEDGSPWAHLTVVDTYGIWGLSTDAADEAAAAEAAKRDRTVLTFERRKVTIELYAPAGNHMWWVVALEDERTDGAS
jgi:hypothetical protein